MGRKCLDCDKQPIFNIRGSKRGIYCKDHAKPDMIDVHNKTCLDCDKRPSFNIRGSKRGIYCKDHAKPDMIDVHHKKCLDCDKIPTFNIRGSKRGIYCKDHAKPDMIDVINKICLDCDTQPLFNIRGSKRGIYCKDHAKPDMIDVVSKTCLDCDKQPIFNIRGSKRGIYCKDHTKHDMIDVKNKTCLDCNKIPIFNIRGSKRGIYCKDHAKDGMVNVVSKTCLDCDTQPTFNIRGSKRGIYCKDHAKDGMVNVVSKTCLDCDIRARYGFPMQKLSHCACHRQAGMLPYPRSKCKTDDCKEFAFYGYTRQIACEKHSLHDMYNLVERPCVNCGLLEVLDSTNFCGNCHNFVVKRQHLAKQRAVFDFLEAHNQQAEQKDRRIDNGSCGNERPDWICQIAKDAQHIVVLEIDEDQHKSNQCSCEITRMINISQSIGMPTLFIRYNPDSYRDKNDKPVKISDTKRREILLKWITHAHTLPPISSGDFLRVVYLFYDGFDMGNVEVQQITSI